MHALERRVLELIGEDPDAPDVFTDDDIGMEPIRNSITDAIQEIVCVTGSHKRQYFIPLRAGQQFYRIKLNYGHMGWITDAWLINKKRRLEQTGIIRLTTHDPRWMIASSDPRSYFQIGEEIIALYPKPSGTSDTLELTIVEIPMTYSGDNAKIKLKPDYDYAAVHFAVSDYWASRGDAKEATGHFLLYMEAMGLRDTFEQSPQYTWRLRTGKEPVPMETG